MTMKLAAYIILYYIRVACIHIYIYTYIYIYIYNLHMYVAHRGREMEGESYENDIINK